MTLCKNYLASIELRDIELKFPLINGINLMLFILLAWPISAQVVSKIIYETEDNCLQYVTDSEGNYIPDYSYAGYKYGEVPLPELEVKINIDPIGGDNTQHIQNALDSLAGYPLDSNGFRGALLLHPGVYRINGSITVKESGIVLRGMGQSNDSLTSTIIIGTGTDTRTLVQLGYAEGADRSWHNRTPNTTTVVTSPFVPAGSKTLQVQNPNLYNIGDNIILFHRSTADWLETINFGDTDDDDPWVPGQLNILYNRIITDIFLAEKKIKIDVPIYDHLDLELSQTEIYKYDRSDIKTNMGIENLRIIIETAGITDEEHARNAIRFEGVEDCWAKDVTALHFTYAGVDTRASNRVTVMRCTAIEPHSEVTGGRRYNFTSGRLTNGILFEKCHGSFGRHTFVSNGASESSGIVFYDCTSNNDLASSEGHRRWSTGMLFDNITFTNSQTSRIMALYNRGDFGTGHGWSVTHSTLWRIIAPSNAGIIVQKPPLRQNYAIASDGNYSVRPPFPQHPSGYIEHANEPSKSYAIPSLYEKQLNKRKEGRNGVDPAARLTSRLDESGRVILQWLDISAEETGYLLEIKSGEAEEFQFLAQLAPNVIEYIHEISENQNGKVVYRVQTLGPQCGSPYSNPAAVEIVTNTKDIFEVTPIIFPNPFQDYFELSENINLNSLQIYALSGRQVKIISSGLRRIDSSKWLPGLYVAYYLDSQEKTHAFKVLKLP